MEYIFGKDNSREILRVKGDTQADLFGQQKVVREFPGETITDQFRVVRKIDEQIDISGMCYAWYEIDQHFREIDKSPAVQIALNRNAANLDYLSMMVGVALPGNGETEVS